MVIASGFIEVNKLNEIERIINELRMRKIEINEINSEKIAFLIERETMDKVKKDFEPLKDINGVKSEPFEELTIDGSPNMRVVNALNKALKKSQELAAKKMQEMGGGLSGLLKGLGQ